MYLREWGEMPPNVSTMSSRSGTLSCVMADEGEDPHRATVRSDFDNLANDAFTSVRASSPRPRASDVAAHASAATTAGSFHL